MLNGTVLIILISIVTWVCHKLITLADTRNGPVAQPNTP